MLLLFIWFKEIIIKKEIDDENLNKIEDFLIQSDVGIEAASEIRKIISTKKVDPNKDLTDRNKSYFKRIYYFINETFGKQFFFYEKRKT